MSTPHPQHWMVHPPVVAVAAAAKRAEPQLVTGAIGLVLQLLALPWLLRITPAACVTKKEIFVVFVTWG